ncbi:MAG: superoxide dismutase family protein [Alphaproteobacteria bacterium]|nr:superoxide dismutase family protein [Alphaproteobacteria bacterium]MBV9694939.1 superoxide dismutase family protein [Alphaproteobacteria bacterium]
MDKVVALAACLVLAAAPALAARKPHAVAKMAGLDGKAMGTVDFAQTNHGVLITFDLHGLSPGPHAIHIHTSGNCDAKVKFTSAGPHFSPEPKNHGFMVKGGPHPGDLPNQFADEAGVLHASTLSNMFSLGNGKKSIFDRDGAAIVVHAKADDYTSQPAGDSGDRVACGVIVRTVGPAARKGAKRNTHA